MTTEQIAESYINGNHGEVHRELTNKKLSKSEVIEKAFEVYEILRANYGQKKATNFSVWIRT